MMDSVMEIFTIVGVAIQICLAIPLLLPVLLYGVTAVRRFNAPVGKRPVREADYAVIVTAYAETVQLPDVVDSILKANYSNFIVYIVADNCDVSGLTFSDDRVVVLRPPEPLASNIRSHFYAIDHFRRDHGRLTIIDSDNLVHPDYFNELNRYFDAGYVAVQGVRTAKNLNTVYACLDEAGDMYYRFVDRKLLFETGSSASLAGSGMAFSTEIYRQILKPFLDREGAGFDKLLQSGIVTRNLRIAFAEQAIVYDEKTAKSDQLVKQRARWINTWFRFAVLGGSMLVRSIARRSYNQFAFSLMLLRPPLFLLLGGAILALFVNAWVMPTIAWLWTMAIAGFVFIFLRSLHYFRAEARIYQALWQVPVFVFHQLIALVRAKRANKLSVATKHDQRGSIGDIETKW